MKQKYSKVQVSYNLFFYLINFILSDTLWRTIPLFLHEIILAKMKEKVKKQLESLHSSIDKEFRDLSNLRNDLILAKDYPLAREISRLEERLHSLLVMTLNEMEELTTDSQKPRGNSFLHDNVD